MKFPLFKATPYKIKNSELFAGAVFSWNLWRFQDGPVVMMEAVRQKSYNPEKKTGTFYNCKDNPDQGFRVKLGVTEIGGLLHAIRTYDSYRMFHNFDDNKTKIDFVTYAKKPKNEGDAPTKAFSLTVNRNGVAIGMGVELAEAEALRVFLETALAEIFYASGQQKEKGE
jgi:hypothetical protein